MLEFLKIFAFLFFSQLYLILKLRNPHSQVTEFSTAIYLFMPYIHLEVI